MDADPGRLALRRAGRRDLSPVDRHVDLRSLLRLNPGPARRWFAARAALAIGLPIVVLMAAGWGTTGFLTSLGAFSAIYGAGAAVRHRARVVGGVGAGLCLGVLLGALTAGQPWPALLVMVAVTAVAGWVLYALRVGPPGAFFFALSTGVDLRPWDAALEPTDEAPWSPRVTSVARPRSSGRWRRPRCGRPRSGAPLRPICSGRPPGGPRRACSSPGGWCSPACWPELWRRCSATTTSTGRCPSRR